MRRVARVMVAVMMAAAAVSAGSAWGQGTPGAQAGPTVVKLRVSGSAMKKPDLAWALLPEPEEIYEGNAAMKYGMATTMYAQDRVNGKSLGDQDEAVEKLLEAPLGEMDVAAAEKLLQPLTGAFRILHDGARRETCTWELNLRKDAMFTLLPYLSPMRGLARRLALAARVDIKRHDWAGAQDKLKTGYAMARHLAQGQTLIEALVGAAIAGQMNKCVEDWVQEPGSPNLFWPLATLPTPLTPAVSGVGHERSFIYFDLPAWKALERGEGTPELLSGMAEHFMGLAVAGFGRSGAEEPGKRGAFEDPRLVATGLAILEYPQAKGFLMERGASREEVEKRSVASVVGEYFTRAYDEPADDMYKWALLPPEEGLQGLAKANQAVAGVPEDSVPHVLVRVFLPALGRAAINCAKPDRQVGILRIVEGVRDYAAREGKLPGSLEELGLPVGKDVMTGEGFGYSREGKTVVVTGGAPAGMGAAEGGRWEITLE
ncbi:MAG: hypothetical protein ACTHN5_19080 [Phycisphaerae bacterium]